MIHALVVVAVVIFVAAIIDVVIIVITVVVVCLGNCGTWGQLDRGNLSSFSLHGTRAWMGAGTVTIPHNLL